MKTRTVQLSDVASVFNGKTPSKADQRRLGHPVLKIKDVDDVGSFVGHFGSFVDRELAAALPDKLVKEGDTLILNAAHNAEYVGSKSFFVQGSVVGALATGEWLLVRPTPGVVDPAFIHFWSQHTTTRKRISGLVKGIHLYPNDVADIPIELPHYAEQQRIARILEQADRLRRTRRYALDFSDTFLPATSY
ncbi:MAG: restriction endonuclease subunit S [Nitrospira sp.]